MVSNASVVLMGMGTVFFGLICIVLLIMVMGKLIGVKKPAENKNTAAPAASAAVPSAKPAADTDSALIAVMSAALAEELGTDVSNVVITSVTRS